MQPNDIFRKSLANYYLCELQENIHSRERALFALRESQQGRHDIDELIRLRSGVDTSNLLYKKLQ